MVKNSKCEICKLSNICKAKSRLKSFTSDAKVDLGVNLTFDSCDNFIEDENIVLDEVEEES